MLLVEDDASVAELTQDILCELGYRVTYAAGGMGGLEILKTDSTIDLVVSDVMMPGLDGVAFARAARLLRADLPIVLASGFVDGARQEAEALGIPLLAKPYTMEELGQDSGRRPPGSLPSQIARSSRPGEGRWNFSRRPAPPRRHSRSSRSTARNAR